MLTKMTAVRFFVSEEAVTRTDTRSVPAAEVVPAAAAAPAAASGLLDGLPSTVRASLGVIGEVVVTVKRPLLATWTTEPRGDESPPTAAGARGLKAVVLCRLFLGDDRGLRAGVSTGLITALMVRVSALLLILTGLLQMLLRSEVRPSDMPSR
jgi:hypothetical protein